MDRNEAERLFEEADQLYRDQQYAASLAILDRLNEAYPNKHRIIFPRARCLARLGKLQDALELCQTLVTEHEYDKARPLLDKLVEYQSAPSTVELDPYLRDADFKTPPPTDGRAFDSKIDLKSPPPIGISGYERKPRRVTIKPVRLTLLILIGVAVWQGWIAWWLGAGFVAAYFILRFLIGRAVRRLIETPFRMKGAVLRGATAAVHDVRPCDSPPQSEFDGDEDRAEPRDWFEIDVTITPTATEGPFQMWEPGELALIPAGLKIQKADDIDAVHPVAACRFVAPPSPDENGRDNAADDDPDKIHGAQRLVITVGVPPDLSAAQFAYYFETFGEVRLR